MNIFTLHKNLQFLIILIGLVFSFYSCSNSDNEVKGMTKPQLSTPINQSFILDKSSIELNWENSNSIGLTGPIRYTIYLDQNQSPNTKIGTSRTPSFTVNNLSYDTTYYWRVEASADGITEKSEQVYNFTLKRTLDVERSALLAIFNALGGSAWSDNANWNTSASLGTWDGVEVNSDGFVTKLSLPTNNLTGTIPNEIENLTHLTELDFSNNNFNSTIPSAIGKLYKLETLNLKNAKFKGIIPIEIANLAALKFLFLEENNLVGPIPSKFGDLKNLVTLSVYSNDLSGNLPQHLGNLAKLQNFFANNNSLNGEIPSVITNIPGLKSFFVHNNFFDGEIPAFSNSLVNLNLSNNKFLGEIPSHFSNLSNLEALSLNDNEFSGSLPNLSNTRIKSLFARNNKITGSLDLLGEMNNIQSIDLTNNQLTGGIPLNLSNKASLNSLVLKNNQLSGTIPSFRFVITNQFPKRYIRVFNVEGNGSLSGSLTQADLCNGFPPFVSWPSVDVNISGTSIANDCPGGLGGGFP